jgi:ferredoxin/flavodoxin
MPVINHAAEDMIPELSWKNLEIYYFSGTGNSLAVARDIAQKTDAVLVPIASLKDKRQVSIKADIIGLVFPVYYGELPVIVKEFAEKLVDLENKYIFSVCTYGGAAMASLRILRKILQSKGAKLSAAYGVHMPQNSFYKPKENRQKIFSAWKKKLDQIIKNTSSQTEGLFYSNYLLELLLVPIQPVLIRPICKKSFVKQTNMPADTRIEELVRMMDTGFETNENCNGCGICSKVCPADNIIINDNKPVWMHHCETCLACYNWCPNKAIQGGITSKGYYYRHPEIGISEIMQQKIVIK